MIKIEIELPNVINKDLQSILKPLNMMQSLFMCAKYKIRDGLITANNLSYCFLSVLALILVGIINVYTMYLEITSDETTPVLSIVVWIDYISNAIFVMLSFSLTYYTNMIYRYDNVLLFLKVQNANKILEIDSRKQMRINWLVIVFLISLYFFSLLYFCCAFEGIGVWEVTALGFDMLMDINLIYASRFLNLLRNYLAVWVKVVNSTQLTGEIDDGSWNKLFTAFMDIVEAYQLLAKTFRGLVSENSLF